MDGSSAHTATVPEQLDALAERTPNSELRTSALRALSSLQAALAGR